MSLRNFLAVLFVCTVIPLQAETLTLTLLDESGTPIPQAKFSYWGDPQPRDAPDFRKYTETNENGQYTVEFDPNTQKSLVFIFESPGYAPFHAAWGDKDSNITHDPIPAEYSVKLEKAITIGGVVLDPDGKPLAGASIDFSVPWGKRVRIKQPDYYVCGCRAKTDENGVWKYESVPSDLLDSDVGIMFKHPDYMNTQKRFKSADLVPNAEGTFTQSVQLEQGITITGRVTDIAGNPVVGAIVVGRNTEYGLDNGQAETNENGEYSLKNWGESRDAYVGVWKAGMMSALKSLPAVEKANPPVVNFTLQPAGKPVTFKIVDKNGESIKGFSIAIERWGNHRLVSDILLTGTDNRPETDENGRWTWREAPESEVVFDMFLNENHMDVRGKSVVPRDEEYVFVSGDPLKISGKVTDEETGETIPTFNVYFGRTFSNKDRIYWDIRHGAGGDGAYRVGDNDVKFDVAVKIEADGYETVISRDIQPDEGSITLDFALKKLPPEKAAGIRGTLLAPDGTPATDANVAMATHGNGRPYIMSGRLYQEQEPYTTSTDKEGKFKFAYIDFEQESQQYRGRPDRQKVDYILFFLHGTGFKRITQQEWESLEEDKIVTLEPWGRIEGTVKVGTQPGKNLPLQCGISFDGEGFMYGNEPHMYLQYDTTADDSGRFSFERVPA
ncbi:MAG: carboxypeptidase regulatory-like domain-containing protein, partial [Planctomycetaceae bacterium]|nr:carboxypeptidase regulatory-like domain-containing protein [Planctomycetaceae bacterium]